MATLKTAITDWLRLKVQSGAPATPAAGYGVIYDKSGVLAYKNAAGTETVFGSGTGDVDGPASAVDNQFALFDSTTGKLIKAGGLYAQSTYTPTLTNTDNISASTAKVSQYFRIGNVVTVSGGVDITPTAAGSTFTALGISLPIASNFANLSELGGAAVNPGIAGQSGAVYADTTNDRAKLGFAASSTANSFWAYSFSYLVI